MKCHDAHHQLSSICFSDRRDDTVIFERALVVVVDTTTIECRKSLRHHTSVTAGEQEVRSKHGPVLIFGERSHLSVLSHAGRIAGRLHSMAVTGADIGPRQFVYADRQVLSASMLLTAGGSEHKHSDRRVLKTWPVRPKSILSTDKFNTTLLELVITDGRMPHSGKSINSLHEEETRPFYISRDSVLAQRFRETQRGFLALNLVLAGIAVVGQNLSFDGFVSNAEVIDAASRSARQLLFALAIGMVAELKNVSEIVHPAMHTFSLHNMQLVRGITYSVQAILGLIALLITVLISIYHTKCLPFGSDPSSIAFVAVLTSRRHFLDYCKSLVREGDLVARLRYRQAKFQAHDGLLSLTLSPTKRRT